MTQQHRTTRDALGDQGCTEDCPHPDHVNAPVNVTLHPQLEGPFRDWLDGFGLTLGYMPTSPDENAGMRSYVVVLPPDGRLAAALDSTGAEALGRMRPGRPGR